MIGRPVGRPDASPRAVPPPAGSRRPPTRRSIAAAVVIVAVLATLGVTPLVPAASASAAAIPGATWTQASAGGGSGAPSARRASAMAYDPATAQTVLFGGTTQAGSAGGLNDTWTWSGSGWTQVQAATTAASTTQPSARSLASIAYDPATAQLLLFGGIDASGNRLSDTWSWNGSAWTQLSTAAANTPSARSGAMLEWDGATGQLVLFGGLTSANGGAYVNDTWLWNGSGWTKQSPSGDLPGARSQGTLTYSPATGQLVLFGGQNGDSSLLGDTWLWTGAAWQSVTPASSPTARAKHTATFDPYVGRIVLFGACSNYCAETWTWTGTTWHQETTGPAALVRSYQSAVFDPRNGRIVLFGGYSSSGVLGDTWTYAPSPATASTWAKAATTGPAARAGAAMAFDGATGQLLLFGGYDGASAATLLADTWAWDGAAWTNVTPSGTSPPARRYAAMTYDPATGQLLLFGGSGASGALADTWAWTSSAGTGTWTNLTPSAASASPSARWGASAGFDAATGQLLLYGGTASSAALQDTWSWSGTAWTSLATTSTPGARSFSSIVFDPSTAQMVLQGGVSGTGGSRSQLTGTYTWNGSSDWVQNANANSGGALASTTSGTAKDFDPVLGDLLLWDSRGGVTAAYDGSVWSKLAVTATPPTFTGDGTAPVDGDTAAAFDPATGQFVVLGGWTSPSSYSGVTWTLGFEPEISAPATATATAALTGYDLSVPLTQTIEIDDPSTIGWNVTISADRAPTSSSAVLPGMTVNGSGATTAAAATAPAPTCLSTSCTAATTGSAVTYPLSVPTSGAATVYSAATGSGVGRIALPLKLWTTVPANTPTGSYQSTITVTVISGP